MVFIPSRKSEPYERRQREHRETMTRLAKLDNTYANLEEYRKLSNPYIQSLFRMDNQSLINEEQRIQREIVMLSRFSTLINDILTSRLS